MNDGNTSKLLAGLFALLLVLGPASSVAWGENGSKVAIVAFGLFGDQSVFESEAKGAAAILANRFGGGPVIVRANTKRRGGATPETLASTLDSVAKEIDHERDLLVLILTSHGSPAGLAVKAGAREEMLSPKFLATTLRYTGVRHRVVIISACYSGIFIPLADADTMVITAADANHPSFGCRDRAQWTYFGDAFFNTAMRRAANLKDAFNEARGIVRRRELRNGFDPSNPQMAGGESIEPALVSAAPPPPAAEQREATGPGDFGARRSAVSCSPRRWSAFGEVDAPMPSSPGLLYVPTIPMLRARPRHLHRDGRDKPGHDDWR